MKQILDIDILVVGSGGGGLVAALAAAAAGRKVLVVEKLPVIGGSTAISGGALWIPINSLMRERGMHDSFDDAWKYLDNLIGDVGPATSTARKNTYLVQGPMMVDFLLEQGIELAACVDYPDYYASRPGGRSGGRSIESPVFNGKRLGADLARLNRRPLMPALALRASDLAGISNGFRTWRSVRTMLGVLWRTMSGIVTGGAPLSMGMALVARLLHALQRHEVEILTDTALVRLIADENKKVIGAVVHQREREFEIRARHGVILAAGGFSHNTQMRANHQSLASPKWTSSSLGDEGDGIRAGIEVGAAVAQMDEAWWMPTSILPDGQRVMCAFERSKPYSIIVDHTGKRFANECASYMEIGQKMIQRQTNPCWFVLDARHRRFYPFGAWAAGRTPREAFNSGYMIRAQSMAELAQRCGIDSAGLSKTVDHYNEMCAAGRDEDFHRGEDPYDCYYGDERVKPNSTMGAIEQAPFYAVALYPGDIGTNGGLLTDEHARVLRDDGSTIEGLYATGNCTASVMGRVYPGAGGTIGPAMVFGFVGARHAVEGGR